MFRTPGPSRWIGGLVRASVGHPWTTLAVWLAACGGALLAVVGLRIDTTIGSALNRSDASWDLYQHSIARHGGDEFIAVALEAPEPFDRDTLEAVLDLTERFEAIPDVRRVDSLATVPLIRSDGTGSVSVDAALDRDVLGSDAELARFRAFVRGDRIAPGSLVSSDERVFALNLVFDGNVDGDRESSVLTVREALRGHAAQISGVPVVRADAGIRTRREMLLFVPVTVLAVALLLVLMFRSPQPVLAALGVGGAGTLLCLAVMALTDSTLSFSTALIPPVLLALACAYTMHMATAVRGRAHRDEILWEAERVARPIALSGLTTAIGFLAMATVRIGLIRDLAAFGSLGVLIVTAGAITLAPALHVLWPLRSEVGGGLESWIRGPVRHVLVSFLDRRRVAVIGGWLLVLAIFTAGLGRLQVASDVILWFPEHSELRRSYEHIRSSLSGITPVNVLVEGEGGSDVTRPEVVAAVDALATDLGELPKVGKALSVADPLRQMHRVLGGDPAAGLPGDRALIQQYLLLLDGVEQMDDVISPDHASANILLRVDDNASAEIVEIADWVDAWWAERGVPGFSARTTGIMYEFGRAQDEIALGGVRGLSLALLAIASLLLLMFREPRITAVALVPNLIPIGMAFGFMGWFGIPLDAATVCLGSLALGIAVDDTIHVVTAYQDGKRQGLADLKALDGCFERVLPALVLTSVVIAIGFGALALSQFSLVRNLGLMTAGVVVVCLLADTLLLPALLVRPRTPGA
jgi:predicted RND superfamily exporter protein